MTPWLKSHSARYRSKLSQLVAAGVSLLISRSGRVATPIALESETTKIRLTPENTTLFSYKIKQLANDLRLV